MEAAQHVLIALDVRQWVGLALYSVGAWLVFRVGKSVAVERQLPATIQTAWGHYLMLLTILPSLALHCVTLAYEAPLLQHLALAKMPAEAMAAITTPLPLFKAQMHAFALYASTEVQITQHPDGEWMRVAVAQYVSLRFVSYYIQLIAAASLVLIGYAFARWQLVVKGVDAQEALGHAFRRTVHAGLGLALLVLVSWIGVSLLTHGLGW